MTLENYTLEDLDRWEGSLLAVVAELRKIRADMQSSQTAAASLEANRANDCIAYLAEWAIRAEAKYRQDKARNAAQRTRDQIMKTRRKGHEKS